MRIYKSSWTINKNLPHFFPLVKLKIGSKSVCILKKIEDLVSLRGKIAIVTGAASGIGKAVALRFAEARCNLHLIDIDDKGLTETKKDAEKFGVNVANHIVDLSNKKEIDEFWERIDGSSIDILANIAGIYPFIKFTEIDEDKLAKVFSINLFSVYWMCQNYIKARLKSKKGGVIINTTSIEAFLPFEENLSHYTGSKAGVVALTRALAKEYGKQGFRVNAVAPGGIKTPGVMKKAKELGFKSVQAYREFKKRLPLGRFGEADEVARVFLFLASDLSSYVNGAVIVVDGGFLSA